MRIGKPVVCSIPYFVRGSCRFQVMVRETKAEGFYMWWWTFSICVDRESEGQPCEIIQSFRNKADSRHYYPFTPFQKPSIDRVTLNDSKTSNASTEMRIIRLRLKTCKFLEINILSIYSSECENTKLRLRLVPTFRMVFFKLISKKGGQSWLFCFFIFAFLFIYS